MFLKPAVSGPQDLGNLVESVGFRDFSAEDSDCRSF